MGELHGAVVMAVSMMCGEGLVCVALCARRLAVVRSSSRAGTSSFYLQGAEIGRAVLEFQVLLEPKVAGHHDFAWDWREGHGASGRI